MPPAKISLTKALLGVKRRGWMRMFSPLVVMRRSIKQPKHWLMSVATAAPVMPRQKTRMKSGASIRLRRTPDMMPFMA